MTTKTNDEYFNTLFIFSKGNIVHRQAKVKLFALGDEQKHFKSGNLEDVKIIEIEGIKVACLICFELRFISLWQKIQGADVILIPAMWGKLRASNYTTLTTAIAITNECYVIAADSSNDDMAKNSGIITPFGVEYRDNTEEIIHKEMDFK
jgi:predicted amidohydrolase